MEPGWILLQQRGPISFHSVGSLSLSPEISHEMRERDKSMISSGYTKKGKPLNLHTRLNLIATFPVKTKSDTTKVNQCIWKYNKTLYKNSEQRWKKWITVNNGMNEKQKNTWKGWWRWTIVKSYQFAARDSKTVAFIMRESHPTYDTTIWQLSPTKTSLARSLEKLQ